MRHDVIYFSEADTDDNDLFVHNGKKFYYKLVMEPDQFVIYDTCNRSIPFDYESAHGLAQAVKYVDHCVRAAGVADLWLANSLQKLGKFYGVNLDR